MSGELRGLLAKTLWHDGLMHVMSPEDLADSLLALFHITEEYRVRVDEPNVEGMWMRGPLDPADLRAGVPSSWVGARVEMRYVLTTKPLPVEENQPDGQ